MTKLNRVALVLPILMLIGGCKDDHAHKAGEDHGHPHGSGGAHVGQPAASPGTQSPAAATQPAGTDHTQQTVLGEMTINGLKLKALQDAPVKPGGEGAFDLVVTGYPAGSKPKAVRFWVGVESGEGSLKAKAEEETSDRWHAHAEVPDPLAAGAKFWAEVEPAAGERVRASFDLKR